MVGNANIVEKIVHVEDKEKMKELEEKLEREKKEIRRRIKCDSVTFKAKSEKYNKNERLF